MDITIFNEDVFAYDMDLETVSSLIRELKDDDPRYWQLAKALQRSLNIYDERDLETVPAARAALAGRARRTGCIQRNQPHCHRPRAYRLRMAMAGA